MAIRQLLNHYNNNNNNTIRYHFHFEWFAVILLCWFAVLIDIDQCKSDRIKYQNIQVLTFRSDKRTASRRTSPIDQLKCVGGSAKCSFIPKVVKCYNNGVSKDGHHVNWKCKTEMENDLSFGKININCEGYEHPKDDFILDNSCGLEYSIDYREKNDHHDRDDDDDDDNQEKHRAYQYGYFGIISTWLWKILKIKSFQSLLRNIVIFLIVSGVIYFIFFHLPNRTRPRSSSMYRRYENDESDYSVPDTTDALGGLWRDFLFGEALNGFSRSRRSSASSSSSSDDSPSLFNIFSSARHWTRSGLGQVRRR